MSGGHKQKAIVISDSDSDTLSESERDVAYPKPKKAVEQGAASEAADGATTNPSSSLLNSQPPAVAIQSALISLMPDRAQMEKERRERARKRRREAGIASSSSEDEEHQRQAKKTKDAVEHPAESTSLGQEQDPTSTTSSTRFESATTPISPMSRYWNGTVKHGYNKYAAASSRGSSIASMLLPATASSRNGLKSAVLATYDLRMDWLYSQFPRGVPVTLVVPPGDGDYRSDPSIPRPGLHPTETFAEYSRCTGWNLCVPHKPKGGWITQHMKFLFLVHETFLRVAILSGNLNDIDWDRIENTAYLQDFPLLGSKKTVASNSQETSSTSKDTKGQILQVLRSLSVPRQHAIYAALDRFDFAATPRANIIASWPEAKVLAGWPQIETQGLGRMGKLVREYGLEPAKEGVHLECQGSSLSTYDRKWLEHFHVLASGKSPRGHLPIKGKSDETHPAYHTLMGTRAGSLPPVKVCFPSQQYVEETTVEGPLGAASFFGKASDFRASPLKSLFHTPKSRRGDVMIHAKSILALTPKGKEVVDKAFAQAQPSSTMLAMQPAWAPEAAEKPVGWSYLGSSNFTRAAHGTIAGSSTSPTMSSRNWELGVMMPIYASEVEAFGIEAECLRAVVYRRPLTPYTPSDTPWDQQTLGL